MVTTSIQYYQLNKGSSIFYKLGYYEEITKYQNATNDYLYQELDTREQGPHRHIKESI